jgi:Flp pilus assembly protein TadB
MGERMVTSDPEEPKQQQEPLTRIEREVLEILERSEEERPPVTDLVKWRAQHQRRKSQQQLSQAAQRLRGFLSPGVLLIFGVALALVAVFALDSSHGIGRLVSVGAIVLILVPIGMAFRRPSRPNDVKRWRGQDMVLRDRGESPITAIKQWWQNRKRE